MRKPMFSLLLLAATSFAATPQPEVQAPAASTASTTATSAPPSENAVASDPLAQKRDAMSKAYHADLVRDLSASREPRDWALAALIGSNGTTQGSVQVDGGLLARAATAAPNDALVQWLALLHSDRASAPPELSRDALARLQTLEPDNASVWVQALALAGKNAEVGVLDDILHRMATSTYSNEHFIDIQKTLTDTFKRHPLPDEFFAVAAAMPADPTTIPLTRESAPYIASTAIAAAFALPAYQALVNACKPRAAAPLSAPRIDECAKIGRTMAVTGNTVAANHVGFALLRITRRYTDADERLARSQDWVLQSTVNRSGEPVGSTANWAARMEDRFAAKSEIEGMRSELVRDGLPSEPPTDWVDPHSPFSAERLERDRASATP